MQQPPNQSRPSRLPVIASSILPGAGQFIQGRWLWGSFYLLTFLGCFLSVLITGLGFYLRMFDTARAIGHGDANIPVAALSIPRLVIPLVIAVLIYVVSLVDAWTAWQRRIEAWSLRQLENRLSDAGALAPLLFLAVSLAVPALASNIHTAVAQGRVGVVDTILENQPGRVSEPMPNGVTPLHLAAAADNKVIAGLLVARGADPNARTLAGFTPLHWAASRNAADTARILIFAGADVNARATNGVTPLHFAATKNATNVLQLLVLSGADLYRTNIDGFTPLESAVANDMGDTALLLAFHMASRELELHLTNGRPPRAASAKPQPQKISEEPDADEPVTVGAAVPRPEPGKALIVPIGMNQQLQFVWIEPLHLWMGRYEIANAQYLRFDRKHSSLFRERFTLNMDTQPVVFVSWEQAQSFCQWLNRTFSDRIPAGFEFRLPSSQEWIAAARCGDKRTYPWGDDWPPKYGNFSDRTAKKNFPVWRGIDKYDDGFAVACSVADSGVNEWGVCGLAGNVWEWCEDWYDPARTYKVRHGGSWDFDVKDSLRIDTRGFDRPESRCDTVGIRLVVAGKKKP